MTTAPTSTATDPSPATPPATPAATPAPTDPAPTETVDHWKDIARKQEQRAKENAQKAKDYDALVASTATEAEKAVAKALADGKAEGLREGATLIAQAEIRAAAAGRPVDVDALLEGVDAARFVADDGQVNRPAIKTWIDKVAPAGEPGVPAPLDLGQGARGGQTTTGDPAKDFANFINGALK